MMTKKAPELQAIVEAIRAHERFVISSHSRPDGDSIGSQLAMAYALRADVVSDLQRDDLVENFIALTRVAKVPTYQTQREADRLLAKSACPKCFHQLFAEILAGQHLDRPGRMFVQIEA